MNEFINDHTFYERVRGNMWRTMTFDRNRATLALFYVLENPYLLAKYDRAYFKRTTIKYSKLRWLCGKEKRNRSKSPLLKWLFRKLVASAVARCLDGENLGLDYVTVLRQLPECRLKVLA